MISAYIFDMDGVIWDGDEEIEFAKNKINEVMLEKGVVFLTNNSLRSRDEYVKRLSSYGINAKKEQVIVSSYAAGLYIREKDGPSKVHALGTNGLKAELQEAGHIICEDCADYVVMGLDKSIDYERMAVALDNLNEGAKLVACAPDVTYLENGRIRPGSGAFVKALEAASGKKAIMVGKPSSRIMEIARKVLGVPAKECLVLGDKLNTEIIAGIRAGMQTALVLTGETKKRDMKNSKIVPDFVLEDLRGL